ncbi:hypothetical protein GDO78_023090 [Eleutherodactylus coqui]|uniref:Uncharacterized protein n=1 Tax=Eleutherodactylus coqui TaxID=57060 RepID=A0A8J6EMW5_ELECQ|nr:hypothetical protein GDO78_023090 [Eleutherodactylus coqui]
MFHKVRGSDWVTQGLHRVVPKPLLCCPGCVLRVIVMLEGDPSAQSEVSCALNQVFIISVLCSIWLFINPDQSPLPQHDAPPPGFTVGMVLSRNERRLVSIYPDRSPLP